MRSTRTPQQFIDDLSRTGLIEPGRLTAFAEAHAGDCLQAAQLGERAVRDGLLSVFQAGEVAAGRAAHLRLKQYILIDRLGAGGMGQVYLAVHTRTGERRAIKVLAAPLRNDPVARHRFQREAQAAARLAHANVVRVFEFDCLPCTDLPYLVMELVDGVSLQELVTHTGPLSVAAAAECGRQVAGGLQSAWAAGLVHRDIKPANLLLDRTGTVKVLDLGIVRVSAATGLTTAGTNGRRFLGTIDYLSPEQALDSSTVDWRADLYSLGATLYFLLAGHPPFPDGNSVQRLLRKQREAPPPVHMLRPNVPVELSRVIDTLLARTPDGRHRLPELAEAELGRWADPTKLPADLFDRLTATPGRESCVGRSVSTPAAVLRYGSFEEATADGTSALPVEKNYPDFVARQTPPGGI